jgi:hypothetical protein
MSVAGRVKFGLAIGAVLLLALLIVGPMVFGNYGKTCTVTVGNASYLHHEMSKSQCDELGGVYR